MAQFTELWRHTCIGDAAVKAIAKTNVYPVHVSQVKAPQWPNGPEFPALSIHERDETPYDSAPAIFLGAYQMDSWAYTDDDAKALQLRLQALFHLQNLRGRGVQSTISRMVRGPIAAPYHEETRTFHRASFWEINWYAT